MDAVIPPDVLAQLQEIHRDQVDLEGWFRTEDVANALGVSPKAARVRLRKLMRAGQLEVKRVNISFELAMELGMLSSCGAVPFYRLKEGT